MNPTILAFISTPEMVLIMAVCLILFGSKKMPEIARSLGQGIREFKRATSEITSTLIETEPTPSKRPEPLKMAGPAHVAAAVIVPSMVVDPASGSPKD